jgi:hypothetical protein
MLLLAVTTGLGVLAQPTTTQPLTLRAGSDNTDTYRIGKSDCSLALAVTWRNQGIVGFVCSSLRLWSTEGECSDKPGTGDVSYDDVPASTLMAAGRADSFSVRIAELPGFKTGTMTPCGSDGLTKTHKVCGALETAQTTCGFGTQPTLRASALKVVYDTVPPSAPNVTGSSALDSSVTLEFSADSDAVFIVPEHRVKGADEWITGSEVAVSAGRVQVKALNNGTTYELRLRARDAAPSTGSGSGNVSEPSTIVEATPIKTVGFWGAYRQAGGTDPGGCASAAGLLPALLVFLPWRRRRAGR